MNQENFDVTVPSAYSNLLGYQSVNVIDPSYGEFIRNFVIDNYYLSIYGTKLENLLYSVQYTKKFVDGRTIWYTEALNLMQINELLDRLESLDRLTERKLDVINSMKNQDDTDIPTKESDFHYHSPINYNHTPDEENHKHHHSSTEHKHHNSSHEKHHSSGGRHH